MTKYLVEFDCIIPDGHIPDRIKLKEGSVLGNYSVIWKKVPRYDFPLEILPEGWWIAKDGEHEPAVVIYELVPEWDAGEWYPNENGGCVEVLPSWIVSRLDPEWLKLDGKHSLYQQHKKGKK